MTKTSDWSPNTGRAGFSEQLHELWRTRPVRLPQQGPIAGVATGFGRRFDVDPVVVRVAFVVSALFGGAGIALYLMAWLLLPQAGDETSAAESLFGKGQSSQNSSRTIVLMVALGIVVSTMGPVGVGLGGSGAISFALMLAGWWLLYQRQPTAPAGYLEAPADSAVGGPVTNPWWTGYPGTTPSFETYGPYTKLPDHYEPEPVQGNAVTFETERPTEVIEPARTELDSTTVVLKKEESAAEPAPDQEPDPEPEKPETHETVHLTKEITVESTETAVLHKIPSTLDRPYSPYGPAPISPDFGPTPPGWDPLGVAPMAWDLPEPAAPVQNPVQTAAPRKPRSRLTPITIGLALLAAAAAGSVAAAGVDWMTPGRIGAAALAVVALGLIVGAFLRRGYGLMVILAPLAGFVILSSLVGPIQFDQGSMGDRTWSAVTAADLQPEYHLGMGSATLDLRQLALTEDRTVKVSLGMGEVRVLLPENLRVRTTCEIGMGDNANCKEGMSGPATGPVLNLDIDVRMGNVEVNRG
ncbi:PspC domain-containing protein [Nocardia yamanashiensis]|uniref:PspC domain-containing protein n=1 Tax=Nocardia yamanashiensis TaxID=209247 RepID=UPI001E2BAA85|nr:PspC domain-containing protein [Nocardia yamanashiensis]UGT39573.1 PspC domain-containing protein [Nocardia yamanashiensis]